jgi:hypothetical protein
MYKKRNLCFLTAPSAKFEWTWYNPGTSSRPTLHADLADVISRPPEVIEIFNHAEKKFSDYRWTLKQFVKRERDCNIWHSILFTYIYIYVFIHLYKYTSIYLKHNLTETKLFDGFLWDLYAFSKFLFNNSGIPSLSRTPITRNHGVRS